MATTKITKKTQFAELRALALAANRSDLVEFVDHEVELLTKKNAGSGAKKPTAQQTANAELAEQFVSRLTDAGVPVSAAAIMAEYDLSSQRASAIMKSLIDEGKAVKTKIKGKVYYAIPTAVDPADVED